MPKPPVDLEELLRTVAFRLLFTGAEPIAPETLARASGIRLDQLAPLIDQLDQAGRIRRDGAGRVVGSAGLSVTPDRHEIVVEGRRFWTWCAYDILGIFGALEATGTALSRSPASGNVIQLHFRSGRPLPSSVVLSRPDETYRSCCTSVYGEWCPNSNLFEDPSAAEAWLRQREIPGQVLGLDEAASAAAKGWHSLVAGIRQQRAAE